MVVGDFTNLHPKITMEVDDYGQKAAAKKKVEPFLALPLIFTLNN
jgi:hypothetical protein